MSFKEKSAAATLAVLVFVYGGYFLRMGDWRTLPPIEAMDAVLIGTVVSLIVLLIVAHIVLSVFDRKQREDERDRMIELIGERNGGFVVGFGAVSAIIFLLLGTGPAQILHLLLAAMVLGEIVKLASQLWLYRRGV